ncbi:MAG: hypothetical protein V3T22_08750, partial [Planctomycetota bacterium]
SILPPQLGSPTERLLYLFEPLVPEILEDLQVVFHPLGRRRYVACAVPRRVLEEEVDASAIRLIPSEPPAFLNADFPLESLNLLTGEFTPRVVRLSRRRMGRELAALVASCFLVLWIGFERRVDAAKDRQEQISERIGEVYEQALGPASTGASLPLSLQLEARLRSLRHTRVLDPALEPLRDASLQLQNLLASWPAALQVETESIRVSGDTMHVIGGLRSTPAVQALVSALEGLEGWELRPPTVRSSPQGIRSTLQFRRREESTL